MARIVLSRPVEADLVDIFAFSSEEWGEAQASRYLASIVEAISQIAEMPERWPLRRIADRSFRCVHVRRHLFFYRERDDEVLIVRVLHASRDIEAALRETE